MVAGKGAHEQGCDDRLDVRWSCRASRIHHCPVGESAQLLGLPKWNRLGALLRLRHPAPGTLGTDDYGPFAHLEILGITLGSEKTTKVRFQLMLAAKPPAQNL